jgi:hypothetical protein
LLIFILPSPKSSSTKLLAGLKPLHQSLTTNKHARKSLLFHQDKTWVKRNNETMFDVTMSSYDGAEICELVGLFILSKLEAKFGKNQVGLYRDDGLAILKARRARSADKASKDRTTRYL